MILVPHADGLSLALLQACGVPTDDVVAVMYEQDAPGRPALLMVTRRVKPFTAEAFEIEDYRVTAERITTEEEA
jgi:hypothetical protein